MGDPVEHWSVPETLGWRFDAAQPAGFDAGTWEDPWGVLGRAVGETAVAVRDAEGERRPATLTLARRTLRRDRSAAVRARRRGPAAAEGLLGEPVHRSLRGGSGPGVLLAGLAWGGGTGPDVRAVAVLLPTGSSEALVLAVDWDDETGLAAVQAHAEALLAGVRVRVGRPAPDTRAEAAPAHWVGASGLMRGPAAALTAVARFALGASGAGRPLLWVVGILVAVLVAVREGVGDDVALAVLLLATVGCVLVPSLLAWRAWTVVHGLATTSDAAAPAARGWPLGLYLAAQALLWALLFVLSGWDGPAWYHALRALAATAVAVFLVLERAREPLAGVLRRLLVRAAA